MTLVETCVRCGGLFVPLPIHPGVANDHWCPACLVAERAEAYAALAATRAETTEERDDADG